MLFSRSIAAPGLAPPADELTADNGWMKLRFAKDDAADVPPACSPKLPDLECSLLSLDPLAEDAI
jgi:hypothetical protein